MVDFWIKLFEDNRVIFLMMVDLVEVLFSFEDLAFDEYQAAGVDEERANSLYFLLCGLIPLYLSIENKEFGTLNPQAIIKLLKLRIWSSISES